MKKLILVSKVLGLMVVSAMVYYRGLWDAIIYLLVYAIFCLQWNEWEAR